MQRSLLAIKGMTSARMIPQLEVAANRVIDVGGVYFNPGKSGTSKQKAAMYKLIRSLVSTTTTSSAKGRTRFAFLLFSTRT